MNREQKTAVVDRIASELEEAQAVFAVDYRGVSVAQVAALRAELRDADTTFRVVKNTLTQLALDKAGVAELKETVTGPTALAFVRGDAALAAKAIAKFSKEHDLLEVRGGVMGGAPLTAAEIASIAKLPARDVLNGRLVGMVAAPLNGLVRSLGGLMSGLAVALGQIAEQGLVSGEAAESSDSQDEAGADTASSEAEQDSVVDEAESGDAEAEPDGAETTETEQSNESEA